MSYIAKLSAVSHGANVIRYITGESNRKQRPELILHVASYNLKQQLSAGAIWDCMTNTHMLHKTHGRQLKNTLLRGELCPDPAQWARETKGMSPEQMCIHAQEIYEKFITLLSQEDKRRGWPSLNIKNCQAIVELHLDSGKPHIHFAINRIDDRGKALRDKDLDVRAFQAAEKLARSEHKKTAKGISVERTESKRKEIAKTPGYKTFTEDCYEVLKSFKSFNTKSDFDNYVSLLRNKGYEVKVNTDAQGVPRGYSLSRKGCKITASNLGRGKDLLVKNLEKTWDRLQKEIEIDKHQPKIPKTKNQPVFFGLDDWKRHVAKKQSETDVVWSLTKKNKKGESENWKFAIPSKLNRKLLMAFPDDVVKNKYQLCGTAINKFLRATELTKDKVRNDEAFMDECIQYAKNVCGIKLIKIENDVNTKPLPVPLFTNLDDWKNHVAHKQSETDVIWNLTKHKKTANEQCTYAIPKIFSDKLQQTFPKESIKNYNQLCGIAIEKFLKATELSLTKQRNDKSFMDECIMHAIDTYGIKLIEKKFTIDDAYRLLSEPREGYKPININNITPISDRPDITPYLPSLVVDMFRNAYDDDEYIDEDGNTYAYYTSRDTIDGVQEAVSEFMGLFIGAIMAANSATPSSGGGGESSDLPWRGNKDDNDYWPALANNCLVRHGETYARRRGGLRR